MLNYEISFAKFLGGSVHIEGNDKLNTMISETDFLANRAKEGGSIYLLKFKVFNLLSWILVASKGINQGGGLQINKLKKKLNLMWKYSIDCSIATLHLMRELQ